MGLFIRKSKKIGPFRLNLSKSGLGVSVGVAGARVSVGPNGTFVHMGKNGLSYRKKLNTKSKKQKFTEEVNLNELFTLSPQKTIITTTNFDGITDVDSEDFIQTLSQNDKKLFLYKWLGILPLVLAFAYILNYNEVEYKTEITEKFQISTEGANLRKEPSRKGNVIQIAKKYDEFLINSIEGNWVAVEHEHSISYLHKSVGEVVKVSHQVESFFQGDKLPLYPLLGFIPLIIGLAIYDGRRKRVDIYYSMDDEFNQLYSYQKEYFKEFQANRKVWQKKTSQRVRDSKYHAGASSLVKRIKVSKIASDSLPTPLIKTNVEIPHIALSNIDLYFFPERLILKRNKKYAAVFYKNMEINPSLIRFIEDERVPRDASVVDQTWQYVNKSGGRDKRFKSNRQLPICQYSEYHLVCKNGIDEVIMTSRAGGMDKFSKFINVIGDYQLKFEIGNEW